MDVHTIIASLPHLGKAIGICRHSKLGIIGGLILFFSLLVWTIHASLTHNRDAILGLFLILVSIAVVSIFIYKTTVASL